LQIQVISVGKIKERYLIEGIAEYKKRLSVYAKIDFIEVADEKAPENLSAAEMEQIKVREGEKILSKIPADSYKIALTIDGKAMSSEKFAETLDQLATYGNSKITFIIGGSLGLSDEVIRLAQLKLSFSEMTFPHQLMKLILMEQLYRAFRINNNAPYHK